MSESYITCSFNITDEILIGKDGVNKVVCFSDGRVVEYFNESIVGSCCTPYLNFSEINVFYSYGPLTKYYVITQYTTLVVLRKSKDDFNIFRTYENIQKYEIADFLVVGSPQVKIWLLDEMEPLITDFSSNNLCNLNNNKQIERIPDLNRKLHMMQSSLTQLNNVSDNRKRTQCTFLKQFDGDETSLILKETWLRIIDDKWIVCMNVKNDSEYGIHDIQLLISDFSNCINTKICDFTYSSATKFFSRKELLPNSCAYVIGIIDEPNFNNMKSDSTLSCSILYNILGKSESIKRIQIPSFMLKVEDIINGEFDVFSVHQKSENLLKDVISCIAIHEIVLLEINLNRTKNETLLNDVLKSKFNFTKFKVTDKKDLLLYISKSQFNSILSNFIVFLEHLSESAYSFVCYARNIRQVLLFKQYLLSFLQNDLENVRIKKINSSCDHEESLLAVVNTLDEEFQYFTKIMKTAIPTPSSLPIEEESNLKFTVETWKELIESTLPLKTDLQLQRALKDDL